MDHTWMDDDQPLYVPEDFEREHLAEARRSIANSRGGRAVARRIADAAISNADPRGGRPLGLAVLLHLVAALMVLVISATTGTWTVGFFLLTMVGFSLAVVARVLHVVAESRDPARAKPDAPRPRSRGPR